MFGYWHPRCRNHNIRNYAISS